MLESKTYLKTKEAAIYMGFSYKTLEAWRAAGSGPDFLRLENGHVRYEKCVIDAWIKRGSTECVVH